MCIFGCKKSKTIVSESTLTGSSDLPTSKQVSGTSVKLQHSIVTEKPNSVAVSGRLRKSAEMLIHEKIKKEEAIKKHAPSPNDEKKAADTEYSFRSIKLKPVTKSSKAKVKKGSKEAIKKAETNKAETASPDKETPNEENLDGIQNEGGDEEPAEEVPVSEENYMYHDQDILVTTHHLLREENLQPAAGELPPKREPEGNAYEDMDKLDPRDFVFNQKLLHSNTYWSNTLTMPDPNVPTQPRKSTEIKTKREVRPVTFFEPIVNLRELKDKQLEQDVETVQEMKTQNQKKRRTKMSAESVTQESEKMGHAGAGSIGKMRKKASSEPPMEDAAKKPSRDTTVSQKA